jgi:rifampicin phosphotransferase
MKYTDRLDGKEEIDMLALGRKTANLLVLASAGYPVPPGFYISPDAYRRLMTQTGLYQVAGDLIAAAACREPACLSGVAFEIRDLIEQQPLPPEIAGAIIDAYNDLGRRLNCHVLERTPVALRSSPVMPSSAHQMLCPSCDTYLNCRGSNTLLQLTRRCWSSLWSAEALKQRSYAGIDHQDISLSVIVQVMINPRASGTLVTTSSQRSAADQCCITAAWGLGSATGADGAARDVLVVDKRNGRLLSYEIGMKRSRYVPSNHWGTIIEDVPCLMAGQPVLTPAQAAYLAALGSRIERRFEMPCELEWAQEAGHWYILSARVLAPELSPGAQTRTDSHTDDISKQESMVTLQT